jgi:hypothetical protein
MIDADLETRVERKRLIRALIVKGPEALDKLLQAFRVCWSIDDFHQIDLLRWALAAVDADAASRPPAPPPRLTLLSSPPCPGKDEEF